MTAKYNTSQETGKKCSDKIVQEGIKLYFLACNLSKIEILAFIGLAEVYTGGKVQFFYFLII